MLEKVYFVVDLYLLKPGLTLFLANSFVNTGLGPERFNFQIQLYTASARIKENNLVIRRMTEYKMLVIRSKF